MFSFLTDSIENALNVTGKVMSGEDVSSREVAKLIADGVTVAACAAVVSEVVDLARTAVED